jgi:hypothetical protein
MPEIRRVATAMLVASVLLVSLVACSSATASSPTSAGSASDLAGPSASTSGPGPGGSGTAGGYGSEPTASDAVTPVFTPVPDASQQPDTGTSTAAGDIPDNAVFLTYRSGAWRFSIQYVEGWQVTTENDGVVIRDKDSSETVQVTQLPPDIAAYVANTDLALLRAMDGFRLVRQDRAKVGSKVFIHLVYHIPSPPDPVTGKQVPSTVDRFYVPGPGRAIVSLATPDGVDNVDAFRQMITSFKWS